MTWEGTREIEEANQAEDPNQTKYPEQTEDDASETYPSNDTRVSLLVCVSNTP
jgi:hypothetical protein